jgi:hypothetical protein
VRRLLLLNFSKVDPKNEKDMAHRGQRKEISSKSIKKGQTLIAASYISKSTIMQITSKTTSAILKDTGE